MNIPPTERAKPTIGKAWHAIQENVIERAAPEDEAARIIRFRLSDGGIDRANDSVSADGWVVDSYLKNPVVLWAHESWGPPVGKSVKTWAGDGALRSVAQFATRDEYDFADVCYKLLKGGFLNAVSVGFIPLEWKNVTRDGGGYGHDFLKQELLEYSVVPVPMHPGALAEARSAGVEMAPYVAWAERALDMAHKNGLWVPRAELESAWFAARGAASATVPGTVQAPAAVPQTEQANPAPETAEKIGRIISRANETKLRAAAAAIEAAAVEIRGVLEAVESDEQKEDACPMCAGDGKLDDGTDCEMCDGTGVAVVGDDDGDSDESDGGDDDMVEIDAGLLEEIEQVIPSLVNV